MKYSINVDKLLSYGTFEYIIKIDSNWPNYLELGFDKDDIPALLKLAQSWKHFEEESEPVCSAPYHAWRVLAQLKAEAAILPLLHEIQRDNDWSSEEASRALALIGEKSIEPLKAFIFDFKIDENRRMIAVEALEFLTKDYPEYSSRCLTIFVDYLQHENQQNSSVAGFVISALVGMDAKEQIKVIRDAFKQEYVDISIVGDLEEVEILLKLRKERSTPKPHYYSHIEELGGFLNEINQRSTKPEKIESEKLVQNKKIGRNDPCFCGSEKKYKKCCLH